MNPELAKHISRLQIDLDPLLPAASRTIIFEGIEIAMRLAFLEGEEAMLLKCYLWIQAEQKGSHEAGKRHGK